ncbi:DUF2934 domain-containing protein [Mucisphaera sp.]|uniref:DUF2934 domain-containing protein n=1 Tax=Mucisphaera sp. TaxID=2913024 RepID=UPI003D0E3345
MARKRTGVAARRTVGEAKAAVKAVVKTAKAASKAASKQRTAKQAAPAEVKLTLTHDDIANRAYFIWLAQGKPAGREFENWAAAERELKQSA